MLAGDGTGVGQIPRDCGDGIISHGEQENLYAIQPGREAAVRKHERRRNDLPSPPVYQDFMASAHQSQCEPEPGATGSDDPDRAQRGAGSRPTMAIRSLGDLASLKRRNAS